MEGFLSHSLPFMLAWWERVSGDSGVLHCIGIFRAQPPKMDFIISGKQSFEIPTQHKMGHGDF
jgi:hypothetical protein